MLDVRFGTRSEQLKFPAACIESSAGIIPYGQPTSFYERGRIQLHSQTIQLEPSINSFVQEHRRAVSFLEADVSLRGRAQGGSSPGSKRMLPTGRLLRCHRATYAPFGRDGRVLTGWGHSAWAGASPAPTGSQRQGFNRAGHSAWAGASPAPTVPGGHSGNRSGRSQRSGRCHCGNTSEYCRSRSRPAGL